MSDLGDRIRARRKEMKLTMRELGKAADCTASFLCDLENGRRRIGADLLMRLCQVLGLPMQETLAGIANPGNVPVAHLPPGLLAWAIANSEVRFRSVLAMYHVWQAIRYHRQSAPAEADWPKLHAALSEWIV